MPARIFRAGKVAVGKYVECDCLPCKLRDVLLRHLPTKDAGQHRWTSLYADQSALIRSHYDEIRQKLLALNCQRAVEILELFFFAHTNRNRNPDTWRESAELDGVREFTAALSVLRERGQIDLQTATRWTAMTGDWVAVAVLDGANSFH